MTDPIVESVCNKMRLRSARGAQKYGTTLADSDAEMYVRLNHLQEELMDAANYIEWIMQEIME